VYKGEIFDFEKLIDANILRVTEDEKTIATVEKKENENSREKRFKNF
jgi:hypothetical protein